MIPLVDLRAQYNLIGEEVDAKIKDVLHDCSFINGKYVDEFEAAFAGAVGAKHCVCCSNATSGLFVALKAVGVGAGDEVITTPMTFFATAEAIFHTGAKPVFVDIDPKTYNIDAAQIERVVTTRTKAILPVHLYGQPSNMDALMATAKRHGLKVVEDCAQAHLAAYKGRRVGTIGDVGVFSFFPGKNLGCYGDGGGIVTNDGELGAYMRKLINHGRASKYAHDAIGYNFRMDAIQAAALSVKLKYLSKWTEARRAIAEKYSEALGTVSDIVTPFVADCCDHVYHIYAIQVPDMKRRDGLLSLLRDREIAASVHYPTCVHRLDALKALGYGNISFPLAESLSERVLSLPIYPEMTGSMVNQVTDTVKSYFL